MKIKTITCQHVYNYGASLQAYALQHHLESMGHDVEIIDFNPWFHRDRYNPFWMSSKAIGRAVRIIRMFPFLRYIWCPLKSYRAGMFKTWGRKAAFDNFEREYYHLTSTKYFSSDELKLNPPKSDVYVAGSDQIWNTFSENGKEPGYYLDFGDKATRRISYAASLATSTIKVECKDAIKGWLSAFSAISVREKTGASLLGELGFGDVSVVLDPVFLLGKHEWRQLATKGNRYGLPHGSYVLVYDFLGNDNNMISFVNDYAKARSLKMVSINDFSERDYVDININNAGPLEFLALIDNAACVVANSFHATAFSVIFEKEFYTFNLVGHNNSSRMKDFLGSIGLIERLNPSVSSSTPVEWDKVSKVLCDSKNGCNVFLKENL